MSARWWIMNYYCPQCDKYRCDDNFFPDLKSNCVICGTKLLPAICNWCANKFGTWTDYSEGYEKRKTMLDNFCSNCGREKNEALEICPIIPYKISITTRFYRWWKNSSRLGHCKKCKEDRYGKRYCHECGQALFDARCIFCKKEIRKTEMFCGGCGKPRREAMTLNL